MDVNGVHYKTIWMDAENENVIKIIDQRELPHKFVVEELKSADDMIAAIKDMHLRGAGLIGAAGGYGMYLSLMDNNINDLVELTDKLIVDGLKLKATRPTAINLEYAVNRQLEIIKRCKNREDLRVFLKKEALKIAEEDELACKEIGRNGYKIIEEISKKKNGETVNILTHCNAGWLAFVDNGTAMAPIYEAADKGIKIHVWVDETRPRNQGARLTAWELLNQKIPHTIITDNAGGHLMQHGLVDIVIVGSDRTTYTGDVANKIGTYLKALAAKANDVPFYAALPSSTFDWNIGNGVKDIPIEQRDGDEVKYIQGFENGKVTNVLLTPMESNTANYAFDVTPSKYVTGLITEKGICAANEESIRMLFSK